MIFIDYPDVRDALAIVVLLRCGVSNFGEARNSEGTTWRRKHATDASYQGRPV